MRTTTHGFLRARFSALATATVLFAVALLFLPVPALLLDLLLVANLGGAFALLLVAARAGHPRRLPQLPALLILGMVLRLGLSLCAVRLILLHGEAGFAIAAAADLVLGADLTVGATLLLCLFAIQYLVVARGSERVAEVAARFTLDALPGQQAAIEADLRAGALSPEGAKARREALLDESQLYGALDGALRFVRGDAAAGLAVLVLGLFGALFVGATAGLGAGDAILRYGLLLSGAAVLTQLPALLSALAAGLLLSRGGSAEEAAEQTTPQFHIEAGEALSLDDAATARALATLEAALGIPVPPPRLVCGGAERGLTLHLRGALIFRGEVGADEDPQGALLRELLGAAPELLGLDEVQNLLERLAAERPALVRETVPRRADLPLLAQVLRRLVKERVLPLNLRAVLEALAEVDRPSTDPVLLTEEVRAHLGPNLLTGSLAKAPGGLRAVVIEAELEEALREARSGTPGQKELLLLEPEIEGEIVAAAAQARAAVPGAVLLCHGEVRRLLVRLLDLDGAALPVLSYSELPPRLPVTIVGRLGPAGFVKEDQA